MTISMLNIKHQHKQIAGYSMIELILSVIVGSIVLAGAYSAYNVVASQYGSQAGVIEVNEMATPTIRILSKAIKKAGYKAVDSEIESDFGRIDDPITIVDSGASICCDEFTVIYDKDISTRFRERYYIAERSGLGRKAILLDKEQYDEASGDWDSIYSGTIIADFVEDMQLEVVDLNSKSQPSLVNLNIIFRSRSKQTNQTTNFIKNSATTGNFIYTPSTELQNYYFKEFETSIILRNLVEN